MLIDGMQRHVGCSDGCRAGDDGADGVDGVVYGQYDEDGDAGDDFYDFLSAMMVVIVMMLMIFYHHDDGADGDADGTTLLVFYQAWNVNPSHCNAPPWPELH